METLGGTGAPGNRCWGAACKHPVASDGKARKGLLSGRQRARVPTGACRCELTRPPDMRV